MPQNNSIDYSKPVTKKEFAFTPFHPQSATPLKLANLHSDEDLMIMERKGKRYAFLLRQMTYHHLAQGELEGEPYLVSF